MVLENFNLNYLNYQLVTQNGFTPEEMEALFNDYFVPSWEQEVVLSDEE